MLARLPYADVEMTPGRLSAMHMLLILEFNRHSNEASVTYAALGDDMPSESRTSCIAPLSTATSMQLS